MVICQGCGQAFDVPEGYARNKIQCSGCGVICPVPVDAPRKPAAAEAAKQGRTPAAAPRPTLEDEAASWLKEDEPYRDAAPPRFDDSPSREEPPPEPAPRKQPEMLVPCRRCGRKIRKQRECPSCDREPEGTLPVEPESPKPFGLTAHALELDEPEAAPPREEEDDESPYVLADKLLPTCPKCHKEMALDAVMCTACGFNKRSAQEGRPIL